MVCTAYRALAMARTLAAEFRHMLAANDVNALASWLAAAEQCELHTLAVGLWGDSDAVLTAVCSSGVPAEGFNSASRRQ
jgi:transposase